MTQLRIDMLRFSDDGRMADNRGSLSLPLHLGTDRVEDSLLIGIRKIARGFDLEEFALANPDWYALGTGHLTLPRFPKVSADVREWVPHGSVIRHEPTGEPIGWRA
jgi:hypothetical protein